MCGTRFVSGVMNTDQMGLLRIVSRRIFCLYAYYNVQYATDVNFPYITVCVFIMIGRK